jgi:hypothetical protein
LLGAGGVVALLGDGVDAEEARLFEVDDFALAFFLGLAQVPGVFFGLGVMSAFAAAVFADGFFSTRGPVAVALGAVSGGLPISSCLATESGVTWPNTRVVAWDEKESCEHGLHGWRRGGVQNMLLLIASRPDGGVSASNLVR